MAETMPILFIGHGSPMNAIEDNEFSRAWIEMGETLPRAKAVLCISAHWETEGTMVTALENPRTIHDFGGFPRALFEVEYPARGSPRLVEAVRRAVKSTEVIADDGWGLDHGAWSVLCRLFPRADVPVVQLSLDGRARPAYHYELGRQLGELREEGILIVGSGNIVHNLRTADFSVQAYDWATSFDARVAGFIRDGDHQAIVDYESQGKEAILAVNSAEHYEPLLYVLALQRPGEKAQFFAERMVAGSLSMRSLRFG